MVAVHANGSVTCDSCGKTYTAGTYMGHDCKRARS